MNGIEQGNGVEQRLVAIGFRLQRRDADCWRVEPVGDAFGDADQRRFDPSHSVLLAAWAERLRERQTIPIYRICAAPGRG